MKKILSFILILLLCFSLASCDSIASEKENKDDTQIGKHEREIVGTWVAPQLFSLEFYKDGTGTVADAGPDGKFTWKYDKDLECYSVALQSEAGVKTFDFFITKNKDPELSYIVINGELFYRTKDGANANSVIKVIGDSMVPLMCKGDFIYCDAVDDAAELCIGDVISFWTVIDGERVVNTSRITEIYDMGGYLIFVTKGDANSDVDSLEVHETEILGKFSGVMVSYSDLTSDGKIEEEKTNGSLDDFIGSLFGE